jgi:phosphate transport system protein
MRDAYHEELDALTATLVDLTQLVGTAMARATTALLDADLVLSESVITADDQVDELQQDLDQRALELMARQQPVAGDLRQVITTLRMSADLERMGDLARHIAKVARLRYPESAVPAEIRATIEEMGEVAEKLTKKVGTVLAERDVKGALEVDADDDEMDRLHRKLFRVLLHQQWPHGVETVIDVTLVGRYYERFADHAVSVARRLVFLVTGEFPEDLPTTSV